MTSLAPHAAQQAGGAEYVVEGHRVQLPLEVREANNIYASFPVDVAAAKRLLPPGLELVRFPARRALCIVGAVDYVRNPLGDYNEVLVAFPVRDREGKTGAYIHRLPVNQSLACAAGIEVWGFPKTIDEIRFEWEAGWRHCHLSQGGKHALTLSVKHGPWLRASMAAGILRFSDREMYAYSWRDGLLRRTRFRSWGRGVGLQLAGARVELGSGDLAAELRSLGFPRRALSSGPVEHLRMVFDAAEPLA